jgi:hypothetical protein
MYEEYKAKILKEFSFCKLEIIETTASVIENIKKGETNAITNPVINGNTYDPIIIYLNDSFTPEKKLIMLYHEYGHAKHFAVNGFLKVDSYHKDTNPVVLFDWRKRTEIEAYKNELNEGKLIFDTGDKVILKMVMDEIKGVTSNTMIEKHYIDAANEVMKENIWDECTDAINK